PPTGVGTIAGKVTDAASTDSAIEGAKVVVEGTSLSVVTTDTSGYYEITNVVEGTYTVTTSAEGYENANQGVTVSADAQSTANFALKSLPAPGKIYVSHIDMAFMKAVAGRNTLYSAIAAVTVVDENGTPVEGAVVSGHWSGATKRDTDSGVTDAKGQVSLSSNKVKNPKIGTTFTFTVDNVSKDGWEYNPEGTETSASISIS
ncbi:MAG TPA: carboxypeptidase regulatory-like domain-containing protein, partial [Anaerovoracaceae bacterium]|nr:carboxypeptidase regulatory-like domain-containing protein [Anaerovoracaceae bacterium]